MPGTAAATAVTTSKVAKVLVDMRIANPLYKAFIKAAYPISIDRENV
jgi:hypothetical protein